MTKEHRTYKPRIVGDKIMMPADLKRLHKYMLDVEHTGIISDEMRAAVEELWPELAQTVGPTRSITAVPASHGRIQNLNPRDQKSICFLTYPANISGRLPWPCLCC